MGKITLPSTILQFFDLGGQSGIRNIWPRYYDDCHAVVYIIDAADRERLNEGWEVFGKLNSFICHSDQINTHLHADSVLSAPKILNVPLLLLANKQDAPDSLSVQEIRENYEQWYQGKKDSARRVYGEQTDHRQERFASLDVMGVSALEG